ncbi:hypothetical protein [Agrobacterium sp. CG674]
MSDRQPSHIVGRAVYFVEILIFAAPFYLTYGLLTVVSVPYAGALLLFSPVWLASYLADANGEITSVLIIGTAVILAAALSVTGLIALWKLARLSILYLFKGSDELSKHRRDFRIGFYCGLAPLIFTTSIMASIGFSDHGWAGFPYVFMGGSTLLVPITHLWVAMRRSHSRLVHQVSSRPGVQYQTMTTMSPTGAKQ